MAMRQCGWRRAALLLATAWLTACGGDAPVHDVVLEVFPARADPAPEAPPPAGWRRVEFAGSPRSRAGTYLVADEALLTGWNITALHAAQEADGGRAITLRANAAGQQKLARFASAPANLKVPLALQIDGRWADLAPLLRAPGDRMTLYGLTADEVTRLERWLEVR